MGLFALGRGTAKVGRILLANGQLLGATGDANGAMGVARVTFDPTTNANQRNPGTYLVGAALPAKAIIVGGVVQVNTVFTSAGGNTGTVAVGVEAAGDCVTAAAVSGAPWSTTGLKAVTPKANTPETTGIPTTVARQVQVTVAGQALLTGKMTINLNYILGA
jgi:hypothetical protein